MRPMSWLTSSSLLVPLHAGPGDDIIPLEGWRYFTAWEFPFWGVVPIVAIGGLYLWGVHVLHRRGDSWPVMRTVSFVGLGLGSISIALFSFLGVYDTVLFWLHMVQHMILNMVAPVFLVSGAPMTLMLRTLPKRPRAWLLKLLHSWLAKIVLFPPLTTAAMVASPFVLYLTGWYDLTLRNSFQHDLLHIYMVTLGCLFFFPLLGVDPVPIKMPYPIRILLFFITMPFHAFLGTMIMGSKTLIAEEWYLSFGRSWGPSPIDDQYVAGALMWATGDLTMFSAITAIFIQWMRDSRREAARVDRALDREEANERRRAAAASAEPGAEASEAKLRYDAE